MITWWLSGCIVGYNNSNLPQPETLKQACLINKYTYVSRFFLGPVTFSPFNSSLNFLVHEMKRDIYAYDGLFTLWAIVIDSLISHLSQYNLIYNVMRNVIYITICPVYN